MGALALACTHFAYAVALASIRPRTCSVEVLCFIVVFLSISVYLYSCISISICISSCGFGLLFAFINEQAAAGKLIIRTRQAHGPTIGLVLGRSDVTGIPMPSPAEELPWVGPGTEVRDLSVCVLARVCR